MKGESSYETRARAAVCKLHDWAGEQKDTQKDWLNETCTCQGCVSMRVRRDLYHGVMQKMRTLFAGLIDFDE